MELHWHHPERFREQDRAARPGDQRSSEMWSGRVSRIESEWLRCAPRRRGRGASYRGCDHFGQPLRHHEVLGARRHVAARVVVADHKRAGADRNGGLNDLAAFALAVLELLRLSRRGFDIRPMGEVAETLECSRWVAAITSDLAGFERYVNDVVPDRDECGLQILPRRGRRSHDAAVDQAGS